MSRATIVLLALGIGCAAEPSMSTTNSALSWDGCAPDAGVYSPFADPGSLQPSSTPWSEDFQSYSAPAIVECSSDKTASSDLDVTAGCLSTVYRGALNQYTRGVVGGDVFRLVTRADAWADQEMRYRFYWTAQTNTLNDPGFKAFLRYQSEDTLYVGGLWADNRAIIKRKACGAYTTLATTTLAFPSSGIWHTLGFGIVGSALSLTVDGVAILAVEDAALSWGAAGVRVDSFNGSLVDDLAVEP